MKLKAVIHEAQEGGFWAEVPAIPGCATQGETYEETLANLHEAIEGCLSVDIEPVKETGNERVIETPDERSGTKRRGFEIGFISSCVSALWILL